MKELAKQYEPQKTEDMIYKLWEDSGFFNPDVCIEKKITKSDAKTFSIVLPPPNVTGTLHLGHAAMLAIEDTIVRFNRMMGKRTLWVPGTDHAAIATQSKVEKILKEETGQTRYDIGRKKFLARVDQFAKDSHDTIISQSKKMGASLDWSREAFTLDKTRSRAVRTAFKKMYDDGLIYQGARIVNWDPIGQTVVSDDEVVYKKEKTKLYYLQYGPFVIVTARPETKFGDKYVVMHPDDKRYAKYTHGQKIELEWINGPITATIIKDAVIDMDFGSGVMTITPWHDVTDFEIAERHDLDYEQIINFDGTLREIAGEFATQPIESAREHIIKKLEKKGLVVKIEDDYEHSIATAERTGGIIEPQIKKQWWIDVNKKFIQNNKETTLKKLIRDAVRSNLITILPSQFEKTYFYWIDNLRDWCISRQIWYGHRIPVWYCKNGKKSACDTPIVSIDDIKYCPQCNGPVEQDPDTLDTWFSSGLWTFSTLGWPEETTDFHTYHPTTLLETGYDILFFWVARMILMTRYLLNGEIPFKTIYLHGLVRDEQGRKMSKSLGNIIDPLDVSAKYGTDAVRLALMIGTTPGKDTKISERKIESYRNFSNKLWNIGRYVTTIKNLSCDTQPQITTTADAWIVTHMNKVVDSVTDHLRHYRISHAGDELRHFTWDIFADWYVEIHKIEKNDAILLYIYKTLLKLWHPFIPFVTEAIWQEMFSEEEKMLLIAKWPQQEISAKTTDTITFDIVKDIISYIRIMRATYAVPTKSTVDITIVTKNADVITKHDALIKKLAHVDKITIQKNDTHQKQSAVTVFTQGKIYIHLKDVIDVTKEKQRLTKDIEQTQQYVNTLKARLANTQFTKKAPKEIVIKERENLKTAQEKITKLQENVTALTS